MLALDAAFGMEYLHLKNIVHFDLKCENLLVNLGDPQRPVCKVKVLICVCFDYKIPNYSLVLLYLVYSLYPANLF